MAARNRPTQKQMQTLRRLAAERGQSFAYPETRGEASREIRRLLGAQRSHRSEVAEDRKAVGRASRESLDAVRVRDDEVQGYGSSATWKGRG
jgi:hypothetical protein